MEKSIESIWKSGFLDGEALIAPKINNLYDQKSLHIIDKFKRVGKANLKWIVIGAIFMLLVSIAAKVFWAGIAMSATLMWLVYLGRKQAFLLEQIDQSMSCYEYLQSFLSWRKQASDQFASTYRFVYPILFLTIILGYLFAELPNDFGSIANLIMSDPDTYIVNGIPVYWAAGVVFVVLLSAIFSNKLYKFDVDIIYGRIFKKIDEIHKEMEELRG